MSSIGSSTTPRVLDYNQATHQWSELNDTNADGQTSANEKTPLNRAEVDQRLLPYGLKLDANGTGVTAMDGTHVAMNSLGFLTATSYTNAPPLPLVGEVTPGNVAKLQATLRASGELSMVNGDSMGELFILMRGSQRDAIFNREMRNIEQRAQLVLKAKAIEAAISKIEAERAATQNDFISACIGAPFASLGGTTLATTTAKWYNKCYGPQRDADRWTIAEKQTELLATNAEQMGKERGDSYDAHKDAMKQALELIKQVVDRQAQLTQKIFS